MRLAALLSASLMTTALMAAPATAQTASPPMPPGTLVAPSTLENSAPRPVRFASAPASGGTLAVLLAGDLAAATAGLPGPAAEAVRSGAAAAGFEPRPGETLTLVNAGGFTRIRVYGADPSANAARLHDLGGRIGQDTLHDRGPVSIMTGGVTGDGADLAAELAVGFGLGAYRFDKYQTGNRRVPPTDPVTLVAADAATSEARWTAEGRHLVEAVTFSRDLVSEPANVIYPESFVERTRAAFRGVPNVTIEVLDVPAMQRLGMGGILSVGQGSARPPRIMVVRYRGAPGAPVALVGKGITFDTGGISIKPSAGMWRMKYDMSGAARVMGAALATARRGAPVHLVAAVGLAENMPDANATRPGDVVRTMNGQTMEIINTDAEGRVVLADTNQYVARQDRPVAMVNMATLTGAAAAAFGPEYAAMFARDEGLATRLTAASSASGDALWRMPLHPNYAARIRSKIADVMNATEGAQAGASLAAHFIEFFTPAEVPWAHLDIAGVAWRMSPTPVDPEGASAYGVRLLNEFVRGFERR
jgi:leucyl aminopeptidase